MANWRRQRSSGIAAQENAGERAFRQAARQSVVRRRGAARLRRSTLTPVKGAVPSRYGPISETYRYIVRSAGVRSGNPTVEGTRIAVHDVIGLLQNGETVDTLRANCFPQLTRSQVYECLAYYEDHRGRSTCSLQADGVGFGVKFLRPRRARRPELPALVTRPRYHALA